MHPFASELYSIFAGHVEARGLTLGPGCGAVANLWVLRNVDAGRMTEANFKGDEGDDFRDRMLPQVVGHAVQRALDNRRRVVTYTDLEKAIEFASPGGAEMLTAYCPPGG